MNWKQTGSIHMCPCKVETELQMAKICTSMLVYRCNVTKTPRIDTNHGCLSTYIPTYMCILVSKDIKENICDTKCTICLFWWKNDGKKEAKSSINIHYINRGNDLLLNQVMNHLCFHNKKRTQLTSNIDASQTQRECQILKQPRLHVTFTYLKILQQ